METNVENPASRREPDRMKALLWKIVMAALVLRAGHAWAGTEERLGTGGGSELRIPVGARPLYLPSAWALAIPSRCRSSMISLSQVATPPRTVKISLLVGFHHAVDNSTTDPDWASMVPPVFVKVPSCSRSVPPLARKVPVLMAFEALGSVCTARADTRANAKVEDPCPAGSRI